MTGMDTKDAARALMMAANAVTLTPVGGRPGEGDRERLRAAVASLDAAGLPPALRRLRNRAALFLDGDATLAELAAAVRGYASWMLAEARAGEPARALRPIPAGASAAAITADRLEREREP